MQMGQVDIVGLQISNEFSRWLWKIPPAPPVARADQPWVDNDAHALVLYTKASVAKDGELQLRLPKRNDLYR